MSGECGFQVDVDPRSPGQFLACCGLLEIADRLWGASGWFESECFRVTTSGSLAETLGALTHRDAEPDRVVLPDGCDVEAKDLISPLRITLSSAPPRSIRLDAWLKIQPDRGEIIAVGNPPWNFWSGQQTSLGIWRTLAQALKQLPLSSVGRQLFSVRLPLSGRFGFDPGAAWNALDVGFSPNEQAMAVASSPAIEMLAAVGVQRFRPDVDGNFETFRYATWGAPLPPQAASVAFRSSWTGTGGQRFVGLVVSRGSYAALGLSTLEKGFDRG